MCSEIRGGDDFGADIGIGFFSEINKLIVCTPKGNADSFIYIGTTLEPQCLNVVNAARSVRMETLNSPVRRIMPWV